MTTRTIRRLARTTAATALVAAALPSSAAAADCAPQSLSKPFAMLGDTAWYFLAPGGDFEGAHGWELAGGATLAEEQKPVNLAGDRVLVLGTGASATSPPLCVDADMPHLRFGARAGDEDHQLRVEAIDAATGARVGLRTIGGDDHDERWNATDEVPLRDKLALVAGTPREVRLRLSSVDGRWRADGVFVDPFVLR